MEEEVLNDYVFEVCVNNSTATRISVESFEITAYSFGSEAEARADLEAHVRDMHPDAKRITLNLVSDSPEGE